MEEVAEREIARYLEAGERVLWVGQPARGIRFRPGDIFMIPFSLMWGGFFIFIEFEAFRSQHSVFLQLFLSPFVVVGVYIIAGRFASDAWRRAHTSYAVTDRRVLIVTGPRSRSVSSLVLRTLPVITLAERRDGSGDVVFSMSDGSHVATGGLVPKGSDVPAMLEFITNARHVYDVILEAHRVAV